jgi:hypothetical protein
MLLITLSIDNINFVLAKFFLFLAFDVKSEETEEGQSNNGTKNKSTQDHIADHDIPNGNITKFNSALS